MVTSNELRIGNWVIFNDNTDRYGQILELHEYYAPLRCGYIPDHNENLVIGTTVDYENLFPIPLTIEILEKCGFIGKYKSCGYSYSKGIVTITSQDTDDFGNDLENYTLHFYYNYQGEPIYYLHQLQNLFWCLTGEELKISFP